MPQLNPEFFVSQLFWLAVTFSFLLFFLWRISLPRIGSVLEKREMKINYDLAAAKELQEKAQEIEEIINNKIQDARAETIETIKNVTINLQNKITNQLGKIDKELDNKIIESYKNIEKNKNDSLKQINNQIHEITKLTITKITNLQITNEEIEEAVDIVNRKIN